MFPRLGAFTILVQAFRIMVAMVYKPREVSIKYLSTCERKAMS